MNRFLAYFFVALLLLQTLGPELLVVNYELNTAQITARYCVNKARPMLHCNGKCHLMQQLRRAEGGDRKAPSSWVAKNKFEVLPSVGWVALGSPRCWLAVAQGYVDLTTVAYNDAPIAGVFHPPLLQV